MTVSAAKRDFFRLLVDADALQFGSFTLKSGRVSPYFFNAGRFRTAAHLTRLGGFFADIAVQAAPGASTVFGPAYKGIPLSIATAMALSDRTGRDVGYLFNRKEEKSHGDRGMFVGRHPEEGESLVMVDDVITDGETKLEAVALLRETFSAPIDALVIAFDRMERSSTDRNAIRDFEAETGIPVHALITLADLELLVAEQTAGEGASLPGFTPSLLEEIRSYRAQFGVRDS
ncbi:MAG: orotate phosphoribosyltransferase [SAR324 cluster bacterium]|nr:orotate phosphoribosyltransferase [SAR324 cluster bacterium]MCZ6557550.1 orotate phosphoribosyltransferase [SAR324 cluster bacterium]MCZ6645717.1 orotate phosphoribosyltransferase [SAR324 cluster bacterium]MCZ6728457.1 orotate phosphoribosyltransferase [SAR324 cluster bacterium]MCZ6842051.1 orotate phosphoribosyltransferase [SAR324 cluster bacterium]